MVGVFFIGKMLSFFFLANEEEEEVFRLGRDDMMVGMKVCVA